MSEEIRVPTRIDQVDVPAAVLLLRLQLFNVLTVVKEHGHYRDSGESCWGCFVEQAIRDTIAETARAASEAQLMQEAPDG